MLGAKLVSFLSKHGQQQIKFALSDFCMRICRFIKTKVNGFSPTPTIYLCIMSLAVSSPKWLSNSARMLNSIICFVVFLMFDLLDAILCVIYRFLDVYIEGEAYPCCCGNWGSQKKNVKDDEDDGLSDSLYGRKNIFREMGFLQFRRGRENSNGKCGKGGKKSMNRWSDCGCESCLSWVNDDGDYRLHYVVKEPLLGRVIPLLWFLFFGNSFMFE